MDVFFLFHPGKQDVRDFYSSLTKVKKLKNRRLIGLSV
ncbi:hypothetical protein AtDm6_1100 [Acetobacter tropicalis]|uniref:Uncharacterized protein n=1 Tax=Acetobacter tropicalis TaxID=104102 RepID=A0A094YR77_9PROT|nr:hypothetical protein AtDm6_1100 [Acetobacter tropicalis]